MASSNQERDKEPMSQRDLASLQKKDRGERKPSDIMVETFVRPGDESWAERAAVSLMRKSASKSKETTPQRDHEMERLRSKESSPAGASACSKESTPSEASKRSVSYDDKINYISGNPFVEVTKGIIHLFKTNMSEVETEMMCMLGVPAKHKTTDLLQLTAPCHQDLEYMRIVHDSSPNQYMVLLKFRSSVAALEFQSVYNGMPYNNLEPEVCSVIPVSGVEQCGESEYYRPSGGGTELPYCTICLDRMDESVSTVLTILCNHRFHSSCLAQWEDPTCPVCRYVQIPEMTQDQLCMDCQSSSDLWICLVCGYVGCGRYAGGHAHQHFLETEHCYSMQLGHNRVWDYVGDNFVHRLVQNTGDGKLVEGEGRGTVEKHHGEAMSEEKMDSLQLEYTYLLTSQLEDQRRYFEKKLGRLEEAAGKELSELTHRTKQTEEDKSALNKELETARKDKIKLESKVSQLCQKLEKLSKEFSEEKQLNKSLRENQEEWQTKLKKTEVQLNVTKEVKDREISDLKDQVRDLMFFLEGRDKVQESPLKNELEEGSIIVAESSEQKSTRKTSKTGKRKKPMERVKHTKSKPADIDSEIPSAPTLEDFYFDPGIAGQESPTFQDPLGVHQISAPPLPGIQNLDISAERSAPAGLESSPPSAPVFHDLSEQLLYMNPHHQVHQQLKNVDAENHLDVTESLKKEEEEEDIVIVPFTDSQLHALYHNVELEKNVEFVDHWLETQKNIEKFQLDEMLLNYMRVRRVMCNSRKKYESDRAKLSELEKELWLFSTELVEEEGECEDGNIVSVSKDVTLAQYNDIAANKLRYTLKQCKERLVEEFSLHKFKCEVMKAQIDDFLHSVIIRHMTAEIPDRTLVYTSLEELRLSISIFFKFLRKDLQDEVLVGDLKMWLERIIAVVLTEATLYDHLFILNHIMRSPAGVGEWAAAFIQPPVPLTDLEETSFENPFLNQLITILATILLPVKERRSFVQEFGLRHRWDEQEEDKVWTVLDEEGSEEEDPEESWAQLRESDMISLFNQVPVDHMFRYVLRVEQKDNRDIYDVKHSSQHSLLKLFAFSTQFVYLLREGLKTFNTPKYRQFAKRLGRLIRHTVHFVSDHWQNFKLEKQILDSSMLIRLQVEYDNFFLRAAKCIFSSQKLGTWQYLADIPFSTISPNMLWRIFYVLHLDYREEHHSDFGGDISDWTATLSSPDLQLQFEEKCAEAGETEVYFLLSAFANMAISRDMSDKLFIERAALDLFDVGYVCKMTRSSCSKNCRDLLSSVCSRHPFLLSSLLAVMADRVQHIGSLSGYLVQDLPWAAWRPCRADLELIFSWLQLGVTSIENHLARTVLTSMDWREGILGQELHTLTGLHVVRASVKHSSESAQSPAMTGLVVSSQAISQMGLLSFSSGPLGQFVSWCWQMVATLHLHMMDRTRQESSALISGSRDIFARLLDYDLNTDIESIVAASVSKNPLASYCCLLLTQVGHSLPDILERGLPCLNNILLSGRWTNVLQILLHIVPLFLCDESCIQNPNFSSIIHNLFTADQSWSSMAKSMISGNFPGPVTKATGDMVEKMISNYVMYSLSSPRRIVGLWLKIVTQIPDWAQNSSALYLFDILCSHSFFDPIIHSDTLLFIKEIHQKNLINDSGTGFISWITGINYSGYKLIFPSSSPQFTYLAFFLLQAEDHHIRETGLWTEIVEQLSLNRSVEEAVAAAANKCERSPPLCGQLPVYRWLQQAIDTPPQHPLQPLLWQRFFHCFLSRPHPSHGGSEPRGIGMSFFSGMINSLYLSKVKKALKSFQDFYDKCEGEDISFQERLGKLYKSYYIWLDEAKILDSTLYIPALSPVYEPALLAKILAGDERLWLEFVNMQQVTAAHSRALQDWDKSHLRSITDRVRQKSPGGFHSDLGPAERIVKRLTSYEGRVVAPEYQESTSPVPSVPHATLSCHDALIHFLDSPLGILNEMSANFSTNTSAYGSLNCNYLEMSPSLWRNDDVETLVLQCCPGTKRGKEKIECSGAAKVVMKYCESKRQDDVAVKLENNRAEWGGLETNLLAPPSRQFVTAASVLTNICHRILRMYERDLGKGNLVSQSHSLALSLFYRVTASITEDWLVCPPLRNFVSDTLELLASVVISSSPGQAPRLLELLIRSPHLSPFLSAHFTPNLEDTQEMINIYRAICQLPDEDGALPFVLLSKVDMKKWLERDPSYADRSEIINIISGALARTGPQPEASKELSHGLQRRHLFEIFQIQDRVHYLEILKILLTLSEKNQLDPSLWLDLLNTLTNSPGKFSTEYQTRDERLAAVLEFVVGDENINLQESANVIAELQLHFHNERLHFGLYGLYPKYRPYVEALSAYFSLLLLGIITDQVRRDKGLLDLTYLDMIWRMMEGLYGPWLFPLTASDRQSAATWIQHLTNENSLLPPWIPGDCSLATSILLSMLSSVKVMVSYDQSSTVLSRVWNMYATHWAQSGVKDHVFGVVHPLLASLDWSKFSPTALDLELMVRVMGMFLPSCHAFLGTVTVQMPWRQIVVESQCPPASLFPSLLCLLVKLSGEPNVRQSGKLLAVLNEAEGWNWSHVDSSKYEALAQWLVMSVDCKCVVKHHERSPLDEATLKLFRAAAEFSDISSDVKKQKIWIKCGTRLLTSCSSKHKNFLSYNQPAVHTAARKILEDISLVCSNNPSASPQVIKDFLTLLNSNNNSVLPGSALMVFQSWLGLQDHHSSPLHSLLNQAGLSINDVKMSATVTESVLEACFRDSEEDQVPSWSNILDHISWPASPRIQQLLEEAVQSGYVLLLFSFLLFRRQRVASEKEEQVIASTVLDWLRSLSASPRAGIEAKLPLLYRQMITLLQRHDQIGSDRIWLVNTLLQFCDVLATIADSSPGWGQNILGAIGLGSNSLISHKGKFLARALLVYMRMLVNKNRTELVEKILDDSSEETRENNLSSSDIKPHLEKLSSFKSNKAFSGIHDLIDWVIQHLKDDTNNLADAHLFLDHIAIDKLYTELYLHT